MVERELARLTEVIAAGGPLDALVAALRARQEKREEPIAPAAYSVLIPNTPSLENSR